MMRSHITDATLASIGSKTTTTGAATTVFGWATANEMAAIGGLLVAVIGLLINWHYRRAANQREVEKHKAEMARLLGDEYGADGL